MKIIELSIILTSKLGKTLSFKLAHPQVSKHEGLKPALNGPHFSPTGDETGILSDLTTLGAFERLSQIEVYTP